MVARNCQIIYGGRSNMCEFCENPTKWNTDDYSLVSNRNLSDGIIQAEDNTYQIGMFDSNSD